MARQSCRNTRITIRTRNPASISVLYTSWIEADTNLVVSNGTSNFMSCGNPRARSSIFFLTACWTCSAFAPGDWKTPMPMAGFPSSENIWL
ncbi:Uncharacterised protein [Mycobacterium tuberculosis]|nr:Uncharacterised protein [Mycobacterium tuberculosis]